MNQGDDLPQEAAGENAECGLSVLDQDFETEAEIVKVQRSPREESFVRDALPFMKRTVSKYCDVRGQSGPTPADFGDHKPIPVDSICLAPVLNTVEKDVDDYPILPADSALQELRTRLGVTTGEDPMADYIRRRNVNPNKES